MTIFGVAKSGEEGTFCYAFIRPVRGPGSYPEPTLPDSTRQETIRRIPIKGCGAELTTWDKILDGGAEGAIDTELIDGRFTIPADCPIEAGSVVAGGTFGPILVMEANRRIRASGPGTLRLTGVVGNATIERVRRKLDEAVGPAITPAVMAQLIELIASQSDLGAFFTERRRIGVIDRFSRAQTAAGNDGPLFVVLSEEPNLRSREPMRRIRICREAATIDQPFRLHVTLKFFDEVLTDLLLDISSGQSEVIVEANGHITDVILHVFDLHGHIADYLSGAFSQGFEFGITAQGRADDLPPVFAGARQSADLENRIRIHTTSFKGPSGVNRSGGLDLVRRQQQEIARLIGELDRSRENVWFDRGVEGQLEVIRWIKAKIENPGTRHAYLVDPYLGSEALQRVIARQGHENVTLTIVVSPRGSNPDSDDVDARATSDHLSKLVATANEWADRLCGRISIVNIQRGAGTKQAFHDRYVSIIDQQGVPTVYLLSNSLSKAAGDWPFAISELDRILSWRVHGYIQSLVEEKLNDLDLHPALIWKSPEPTNRSVLASAMANVDRSADTRPEWTKYANALLADLWSIVIQNTEYEKSVGARVQSFLESWSSDVDAISLAEKLFDVVGHRDEVIVFVSAIFAAGTAEQIEIARRMDDLLLDRFLAGLPQTDRQATRYIVAKDRNTLIQNIGRTIARKDSPTNFIRAKLNPIIHRLVQIIESQRFEYDLAFEALEYGILLVSVGLAVAIGVQKADERFRTGVAVDYIHWFGRLARSEIAQNRFSERLDLPDSSRADLKSAVGQILAARSVLSDKIDTAIRRVLDDPLVLPLVKGLLDAGVC
jgi:hypothetical protein